VVVEWGKDEKGGRERGRREGGGERPVAGRRRVEEERDGKREGVMGVLVLVAVVVVV